MAPGAVAAAAAAGKKKNKKNAVAKATASAAVQERVEKTAAKAVSSGSTMIAVKNAAAAAAAPAAAAGGKKSKKKKGTVAAAAPANTASATEDKAASKEVLGDIFSGLKAGKKAKAEAQAKAPAAAPAGAGEAKVGAPYITGPHKGYIPAGGNLLQRMMTLEEAKKWALQNKACLGFTYEGRPGKDGKILAHMKNKYPPQGLMEPGSGWTSYQVANREKIADSFMDLRGEGSSAKVRTTKDGFAIVAADELMMDSGGNTPQCPFDCQCCW